MLESVNRQPGRQWKQSAQNCRSVLNPGPHTKCPLVSGTKVEWKSEIYMSSCVQYILNAKGVQKVFMHVRLDKFTGCAAVSLTASRRSGAVHYARVCVCIPLRISESTGRLIVNCSQISLSHTTTSLNLSLGVTKLHISCTNCFEVI
jgi:hypothetical protein